MPVQRSSLEAHPAPDRIRCLFIVARDQSDLWHSLRRDFGVDAGVRVLLNRRRGERRQRIQAHAFERRRADRRRQPSIDNNLRYRSFVIVHEQQGVLSS